MARRSYRVVALIISPPVPLENIDVLGLLHTVQGMGPEESRWSCTCVSEHDPVCVYVRVCIFLFVGDGRSVYEPPDWGSG